MSTQSTLSTPSTQPPQPTRTPASASQPPSAAAWRVLSFPSGADVKAIAAAYAKDPNVAFAEPNYIGSLGYLPADPAYAGRQKNLYGRLQLEQAWEIQRGDPSIIVAVIDSGVDVNHPDLAGAIAVGGWDFADGDDSISDDLGHGTRVAGIIAAAENAQGGVGAAFGCRILPFDVSDSRGSVRISDVAAAVEEAAAKGAHVINLSLTFRDWSQLLRDACAKAAETAVIVAAAGNDGQGDSPRYPASFDAVLPVGATDENGGCAIFSNFNGRCGSLVKLVAPGVNVYSTTPGGGWSGGPEASGTSFAAPFVSAAAALLRAKYPEQSPAAIARHLQKTATYLFSFREEGAFWRYSCRRDQWGMGAYMLGAYEQGAGQVNPWSALATPMTPTLSVSSVAVVDDPSISAINDGDGELDKGEVVRLSVNLSVADCDALSLVTRLTCADSRIALVDSGTTVTQLSITQSKLRCGATATLPFANVYATTDAARGEVSFALSSRAGATDLPDLTFTVRIENKVRVSGPQPDVHFLNENAYIVTDTLTLSGNCLIDPGTPFTVHPGKKIQLLSGGNLTAVGTDAAPITFTSLYKIPDLSKITPPSGPIAGLSDPHNVGLLNGMTVEQLTAQCGPKTEPVNLANYQQVRYVSANTGSDTTGDGSAGAPWQSIQHALDQIGDALASRKYALLVAEGSYSNPAATTGTAVATMKQWVDLWGGFEAAGWTRDIAVHVSMIDGVGTNSHRCVNGASNARIDGFTITGGRTNYGFSSSSGVGAGIYCPEGASPAISNNIISGNSTDNNGYSGGGGIFCQNGSPMILNNGKPLAEFCSAQAAEARRKHPAARE